MANYDIIGNIAILRNEDLTKDDKLKIAKDLLKSLNIDTVVERVGNVKGRLRTINVKHIAGKKTLVTEHKENNCRFKLNIESCYFSPRLSNDRKDVASHVKGQDKVLVMFAGVGVYPIVIYKLARPKQITAIEISRECCKYFKENLDLNKIPKNRIEIIQGDVKKKINKEIGKFDIIMMARPNLKDTFLEQGLKASKRGTKIFYHGFCRGNEELEELKFKLINEAEKINKKIKIERIVKAGEIAPYKFRWRIEMRVVK